MCNAVELKVAAIRYRLVKGVTTSNELSSLSALYALNISIITRTERESVAAFTFPLVKYSQGWLYKSIPSIKLFTLKSVQAGHSDQCES